MNRFITVAGFLVYTILVSAQDNADLLMKSKALIDRGKASEAVNLLLGTAAVSSDYHIWLMLAEAKTNIGDYRGAESDFKKASSLLPGSGEYGLSRIAALKGDAKGSLYHLDLNIQSDFKKSEKEIMLDPAFSVIENTPEWRSFWKTERYGMADRKVPELEYYLSAGKKEEALNILDDLKSQYPGDNRTLYATALVDYSFQKYSEAMTILSQLTIEDKTNESYLRLQAFVQTASGNPSGASTTYGQMLLAGINDAGIYLKRAECYRKTGEQDKAIKDLDKYLSFYPDNKEALSLTGRIEAESGDNLKALEYFSKNLKLHPSDPECYIDRANSYFLSRSWDYAISDYSMALDIKPDNSEVWLNKGISLLGAGKTEDACHDFRKALSLGNKKAASYISKNCIK